MLDNEHERAAEAHAAAQADAARIAAVHPTLTGPLTWANVRDALGNLRMVTRDVPGGILIESGLTLADGSTVCALVSHLGGCGWFVSDGDMLYGELGSALLNDAGLDELAESYRIAHHSIGYGRMVKDRLEMLATIDDVLGFQVAAYAYAMGRRDAAR